MNKQKPKTHKATVKRFQKTGTNKIRHNRQGDNAHLKVNKGVEEKSRKKGKVVLASKRETRKIIKLLQF